MAMTTDPLSLLTPESLDWAADLAMAVRRPDRPGVVMKLAMTLDGKIAVASGDSRWISGEASRALVHVLRSRLGGVMVGAGTVLADDPLLNVRLPFWPQATRVLVQGRRPWPGPLAALNDPAPLIIATTRPEAAPAVSREGHRVWTMPPAATGVDLSVLLQRLGEAGVAGLLLEGGSRLNGAMLAAGLVDHVVVFVAPKLAGDGPTPVAGLHLDRMADAIPLNRLDVRRIGDDIVLNGAITRR
jgi:diaminohydroxyphosphoribosylaminopyrimidine deaminase/5-amino-6-(5-phosphoribosylamino)uracil reductase